MSIQQHLTEIRNTLPSGVTLIAVSKTKPVSAIQEAYDCGQRDFGENKVQEMNDKQPQLPADIRWHLIGHLQSNKVKYIAPYVHLIHSVDSLSLLEEINKQALKHNRVIDCLLQFHIAQEETKFGLDFDEATVLIEGAKFFRNVRFTGVMGMATFTDDEKQVRDEFKILNSYFNKLKSEYFHGEDSFINVSMGMSDDYELAIAEGSTMIRVGSKIFGER